MKGFRFFFAFAFILTLIFPSMILAEGTKQLMPDSASNKTCKILIANGNVSGQRDPFALYNGDTNYRLFIHISDSSKEKIYFGLGASSGSSVNWRIHNPDGTVLWAGTTPIASSPSGYIKYYNQAYNGPTKLNPQGYPAVVVVPVVNGDYFMTFQVSNGNSRMFEMFDITVIDTTTTTAKNGRVFSKAWQLSTFEPSDHGFFGKLFPYTNDGIVSKFDPNGFLGRWFTVSCNESGCYKIDGTHNAQQARRSTNGWHNYPQYKIFLNDPDTTVYPSGTIGQMIPDSLQVISNCNNGTIEFIILTTAKGNIEITLELAALGPPYVNRILVESTNGGKDTITWDGKDGNGVSVNSGASFLFTLRFYNGLTHLPLWDVENNPNGFKVTLIRPQGVPVIPDPEFFWDDSQVGGGTLINPPGCTSTPTSGCHSWTGDWGDNRTINTWWFVVSTTTTPVYITYKKGPQNLGVITGPSQVCQGTTAQYSVANDPNSTQYDWTWPGGYGTTYTPTIIINIPSNATPGPGQIAVNGVNSVCGAGPVSTKSITINEIPSVTNSPKSKSICQNTGVNLALTATIPGTTFQWSPSCGNPAIGGYSNGSGIVINDVLTNTGFTPGIVEYVITPFVAGCQGDTIHYLVTVNPEPDLTNNPPASSICSNTGTNLTLTSNVTGALFTWTCTPSSVNLSGFNNNGTPSGLLNQTLVNSGFTAETVTYHITPHANGCDGDVYDYIVTIYPLPDLSNNPLNKTQCNNATTNITLTSNVAGTLFTWTCSPSSINLSGFYNNATPTGLLDQTLVNSGYTAETVTYHITPHANGCDGNLFTYVVTVYPAPDLSNNPLNKSQCNNTTTNITLTSNVTGTLFTWTCTPSSVNLSGFYNNATPAGLLDQTIINSGFTAETVTYHITPNANGCDGPVTDFIFTVFPTPNLSNNPASKLICNNTLTNITLTSDVAGALFTWTSTPSSVNLSGFYNNATPSGLLDQTLVNSGFTTEAVTYHLTPHANGCDGPVTDFVVTVYPVPNLSNNPPSKQICNNTLTNITLTSNVAGALFTWTCTPSSVNLSGFYNNATPSGLLDQTLMNSGFTTEVVTYHLTPHANGCDGSPADFIVTVYPSPNLSNNPLAKQLCNNSTTNIGLTSNVTGTLFTWSCTPSSINLSGFYNNATPSGLIDQTLVNSGYNIETVTYHITPHANGCDGPITDYVVTVYPTPDLSNNPLFMQVCNSTPTNQTLLSNVAGTLFTWTATGSSPLVSGYSDNPIPTAFLNQTLINAGLNVEFVTYLITPHANGCDGPVTNYVVTVVSSPDVYFNPSSQTICSQQTSSLQILSHVPGTTFAWTASGSSLLVTGYSDGAGNMINQTVQNSGITIETVTYTVTPTAWGCPPGMPQNLILTVNPKPAITNPVTAFQQCSAATTNIVNQSSVPGSTYTWTATGSSLQVTGFSAGTGNQIQQTLINTGFNIETVTYNVTPIANICPGDPTSFTVTVFPVPDVYFIPPSQALCPLQTSNITNNSHVSGSAFTWTASGSSPLITGYSGGSGPLIQQTLDNSGFNIETVTYQVAPTANGCPGINNNVVVTVNPAPVVTFALCVDPVTTTDAQPIKLKGGNPVNGTYTGRGVSGATLYPALAGVGTDTIFYSFSNTYGCSGNNYLVISIISPLPFSCGNTLTDPRDSKQYLTVPIDTQCWMAENLDYGTDIPSDQNQRDNCINEKYLNPGSGMLHHASVYQWDELMKYDNSPASQGFCPPGWHVPTEANWNTLFNFFISSGFAGSPLKYSGYSGFNALLDGARFKNASWHFDNFATLFWSSTSHGPYKAWAHGMNEENPSVSYYPSARSNAFPVRCIKD